MGKQLIKIFVGLLVFCLTLSGVLALAEGDPAAPDTTVPETGETTTPETEGTTPTADAPAETTGEADPSDSETAQDPETTGPEPPAEGTESTEGTEPAEGTQDPTPAQTETARGRARDDLAVQMLHEINTARTGEGVSALNADAELNAAARVRAQELVQSFSHTRPDGSPWYSVSDKAYAENIAKSKGGAAETVKAWLDSAAYRADILSANYATCGVCAWEEDGTFYWVLLMGRAAAPTPTPVVTPEPTATPEPTPTAEHTHDFENGVCKVCGYVCTHEETTTSEKPQIAVTYKATESNLYHVEDAYVTYSTVVCTICGEKLESTTEAEHATSIAKHVYDLVDGAYACKLCGHVSTCFHGNLKPVGGNAYKDIDDNRIHRVSLQDGASTFEAECQDCGMVFSLSSGSALSAETEEPHAYGGAFTDKTCAKCGHVNTCAHENLLYRYEINSPAFDMGSDTDHYYIEGASEAAGRRVPYCPDCGQVFDAEAQTLATAGKYAEAHTYDDKGVCTLCGHVRPNSGNEGDFTIDLSEVVKENATSGKGTVYHSGEGTAAGPLYARVTWVYTLANEDTFAYCAMKDVVATYEGLMTFNMVSPRTPYGAVLDTVQVALVTDPEADGKGSYDSLATAKK